MNIEEAELYLNSFIDCYNKKPKEENRKFKMLQVDNIDIKAIETLLTAYEKEKEKNKELYMQHNQMIIDILKECDYMIKNRHYMNDVAIRQHAERIKDIAKYYIKEPEWIELKEE